MGDPPSRPQSPTPDLYSILGISKTTASIKDICKGFMKWSPIDKTHHSHPKAESVYKSSTAIKETEKSFHRKNGEGLKISEPIRGSGGHTHHGSADESMLKSSPTFLLRSMSRRSQTPTPSPRSSPLSRMLSRRSTSEAETAASLSRNASRRGSSEAEILRTLSRNASRRNSTPIVYSQSTASLKRPPPVEKKLHCTLEELCDGCLKKINITRDVIENGIIVEDEETLTIEVKPGWMKGTKITFEGKGDEKPGYLPADIIFLIEEKKHTLYRRDGFDLEMEVEIPLVKALTGCSITIPMLGGEKMSMSFEDIIFPGFEKVIRGQGMPNPKQGGRRGDLRIIFHVSFPLQLSSEQRAQAFNILRASSPS